MSTLQIAASRMRIRVQPGYARRWIKRNWWRAFLFAGFLAAALTIRQPIPCAACWIAALGVAVTEEEVCITRHKSF